MAALESEWAAGTLKEGSRLYRSLQWAYVRHMSSAMQVKGAGRIVEQYSNRDDDYRKAAAAGGRRLALTRRWPGPCRRLLASLPRIRPLLGLLSPKQRCKQKRGLIRSQLLAQPTPSPAQLQSSSHDD